MLSGINQSSQMASLLFSKLDTKSQGYIEKTDLASAFSQISSSDSSSVDDVFAALDSDSDGKVTKSEFSTVLSQLQEELESQFNQMRMQGMGGMPPPPPPGGDAGFTKDELSAQLEEADRPDSERTSLISSIVDNFEAADTDGDGKVSFREAMAYKESSSDESATSSATATASSSAGNEAQIMRTIMQLMHAYGSGQEEAQGSLAALLSTSA
jgi:Ca2+-binding EF-hand superfamily protein